MSIRSRSPRRRIPIRPDPPPAPNLPQTSSNPIDAQLQSMSDTLTRLTTANENLLEELKLLRAELAHEKTLNRKLMEKISTLESAIPQPSSPIRKRNKPEVSSDPAPTDLNISTRNKFAILADLNDEETMEQSYSNPSEMIKNISNLITDIIPSAKAIPEPSPQNERYSDVRNKESAPKSAIPANSLTSEQKAPQASNSDGDPDMDFQLVTD